MVGIIGETDSLSIGHSYIVFVHTEAMQGSPETWTFWKRLESALKAADRKSTQVAAAKAFHVEQGTVSGTWNKPGGAPELKRVLEMSTELNVCVEWLYSGRGPMHPLPDIDPTAEALLRIWPNLTDEARMAILGFATVSIKGENPLPFAKARNNSLRSAKDTR